MSEELDEKLDRLTHLLERQQSFLWTAWHSILSGIFSIIGVLFVLTVGVYVLQKLEVLPGLNLLVDEVLQWLQRVREIRGLR